MRSYSSLLAHLLGSSDEIDGYGETHLKYKRATDLWRLRKEVQRSTGQQPRGRYVLDKILHNYIRPPDRFIAPEYTRALIFLRRPDSALRSMLTLGRIQQLGDDIINSQTACDYYVSRLHRLRMDGQRLGHRSLYLDAEALLEQPQAVLDNISDWLQLEQPLQTHYQVLQRTGETGFGDPLHNIRAGQVLERSASTIDVSITIPAALLREADAAYQRCRDVLLQCCQWRSNSCYQ